MRKVCLFLFALDLFVYKKLLFSIKTTDIPLTPPHTHTHGRRKNERQEVKGIYLPFISQQFWVTKVHSLFIVRSTRI